MLAARRSDLVEAVAEACSIMQSSVAERRDESNWHVSQLEATFGLTLTTEAGVILGKAGAEASFEVTITVERAG